MPYETYIELGTPIIADDAHDYILVPPSGFSTGLESDPFQSFCAEPFISPFPQDMYVPRSEWDDRLEAMDKLRASAKDIGKQAGIRIKDQDGFGWCWGFGTCSTVEYARAVAGLPYVQLSASSVCGPVKRYANQGGWGKEALAYGVKHGWAPADLWPECPTGANPRYDNDETKAARKNYVVLEWFEIPHRDFDGLMSALFHSFAAAVGLNHWGHLICATRPVKVQGQYGFDFDNSWRESWGNKGTGVLLGSKAIPDDVTVVPRITTYNAAA